MSRRSAGRLGGSFWSLWGSTATSKLGDGLLLVALPLLATHFTRSPLLVAGVLVAQRIPWVAGGPAGTLVDRTDRVRLMVICDLGRAAVLLGVGVSVLSGTADIAVLYACALAVGAGDVLHTSCGQAVIPQVVESDRLERANGLLVSAEHGGEQFAGPALGGLVVAAVAGLPFVADGVTFLASAALLAGLRRRAVVDVPELAGDRPPWRVELVEGLRYTVGDPLLRVLTRLVASLAFCQAAVTGVLVLFAVRDLHLRPAGYGLMMAVAAVGNVVGALCAERVVGRFGSATVLGAGASATAAAYLALGASRSAVAATCILAVETLAVGCGNVASAVLRQRRVPPRLMGRVSGFYRTAVLGCVPLGAVAGGLVASTVGLRGAVYAAGLLQAGACLLSVGPLRRAAGAGSPTVAVGGAEPAVAAAAA